MLFNDRIIIKNKARSIKCSYTEILALQSQIAEGVSPIFRDWYDKFLNPHYIASGIDDKLCNYYQILYAKSDEMMEFLFEFSYGSISNRLVRQISKIIKNDNEDSYIGNNYVKYLKIKDIFLESAKNNWIVRIEKEQSK